MELLSYVLPVVAAVTSKVSGGAPKLPSFKPRFWYNPEKLDARPVAWSLRNKPEEWEWRNPGYTIRHKPSGHVFWVANGFGHYYLYNANCRCSTATNCKFQRFQQAVFHRAFRQWRVGQTKGVHEHFADHFIH